MVIWIGLDRFSHEYGTYPGFQFWWESGLEFHGCTVTVVSLDEYFHVIRLQSRRRHGAQRNWPPVDPALNNTRRKITDYVGLCLNKPGSSRNKTVF